MGTLGGGGWSRGMKVWGRSGPRENILRGSTGNATRQEHAYNSSIADVDVWKRTSISSIVDVDAFMCVHVGL